MWTMGRSDIDPNARPINHPRETIMKVFFSVTDIALVDILAEKPNEFDPVVDAIERKSQAAGMRLHCDNASIHNK
jgi:hypothetical protein